MSPIAVPMVPQGGRVLVAEWWEARHSVGQIAIVKFKTRDDAKRAAKACRADLAARGVTIRVIHVRRYRKVK